MLLFYVASVKFVPLVSDAMLHNLLIGRPTMALTAPTSLPMLLQSRRREDMVTERSRRPQVLATGSPVDGEDRRRNRQPGVDTRIHWDSPEEGWVGGRSSKFDSNTPQNFRDKFSELLNARGTHYEFLGVPAQADLEDIKAAYRRLSKEYHPDTTSLPLKAAFDNFMHLREVYDVLSNEQRRQFYDWSLAKEAAGREAERMKLRLEDPYEQDVKNWQSSPDMADRLGGKNMELSDQTLTALTFDVVAVVVSVCCIIYAIFFKEPS